MTMQLPPYDNARSRETQGMYRKFAISRVDGKDKAGLKHFGCEYFVLDMDHDQFAGPALLAYADACDDQYPVLATELRERAAIRAKP